MLFVERKRAKVASAVEHANNDGFVIRYAKIDAIAAMHGHAQPRTKAFSRDGAVAEEGNPLEMLGKLGNESSRDFAAAGFRNVIVDLVEVSSGLSRDFQLLLLNRASPRAPMSAASSAAS